MCRFFSKSPTALLLTGVAIGAIGGACVATAAQPNMQAALGSLQAARAELIKATPNKGGHRERAIGSSTPRLPRPRPESATPALDTGSALDGTAR